MRVRFKPTGAIGELPDNEFDPTMYESLSQPVQSPVTSTQTTSTPSQQNPEQQVRSGMFNQIANFIAPKTTELIQGKPMIENMKKDAARGTQVKAGDFSAANIWQAMKESVAPTGDFIKSIIPAGLEIGSLVAPAGKGFTGAVKAGAMSGALRGASEVEKPSDVLPKIITGAAGGGIGGGIVGGAGRLLSGKGAQKAVSQADEGVDMLAKSLKETPEVIAKNQLEKNSRISTSTTAPIKLWLSAFNFPTKVGKRLQPQSTAKEMLDYGITGGLDKMESQVGDILDATTRLTDAVAANLKKPIPLTDAAGEVEKVLGKSVAVTPAEKAGVISHINNGRSGVVEMTGSEALSHVRELEKYGHQFLNSSTYLTGNIKNEQIGEAYLAAAEALKKQIEKSAGAEDVIKQLKTPDLINIFNNLNPKLGKKIASANTLSDIRAVAAPFVRTKQMIDYTNEAAQSSFNKLADKLGSSNSIIPSFSDPLSPLRVVADKISKSPKARTEGAKLMENTSNAGKGVSNFMSGVLPPIQVAMRTIGSDTALGLNPEQMPNSPNQISDPNNSSYSDGDQPNRSNQFNHNQTVSSSGSNVNSGASGQSDYVSGELPSITGHTPEELYQGMMKAQAAGDKASAAALKQMYSDEVDFQTKTLNKMQVMEKLNKPSAQQLVHEQLNSVIDDMSNLYGTGTGSSLSQGDSTVGISGILPRIGQEAKKTSDQGYVDRLASYNSMRALAAGIINKARQAGTLNSGEYEIMIQNMPTEYSSETQAKAWFANAKKLLSNLPVDEVNNATPNYDINQLPPIQ